MEHLKSAINLLRIIRQQTDRIGVAVSFGKDSFTTLDLCASVFSIVEGYYLYRVAGLRVVEEWRAMVEKRWGVNVRPYPHFDLSRIYRNAVLQPHHRGYEKTPKIDMADVERAFRNDAKVDWIAYGWRRNDSFSRALIMKKCAGLDPKARRVFPLRAWSRAHVFEYLDARKIPRPDSLGRKEQAGLDFHPSALCFLRDNYPDDWAKWLEAFPFSEAQIQKNPNTRA